MKLTAITLDLDDTLWPIAPVMERADAVLHRWMELHCPRAAQALSASAMRALRDRVFAEHPHLGHDFTALRMICLRAALLPHGYGEAEVEGAYEVFYTARNQVDLYPEVATALERMARCAPLVSLSNGNACLQRVGLAGLFHSQISARSFGRAKPDPAIFHAACALVGSEPAQTLHVGDHPEQDVLGALGAGLNAAWINREQLAWPHGEPAPMVFACLSELADYVEART